MLNKVRERREGGREGGLWEKLNVGLDNDKSYTYRLENKVSSSQWLDSATTTEDTLTTESNSITVLVHY